MSGARALRPPATPHSPWQLLYTGAHWLRRQWWRRRAARLPRIVISVGNLHWGGSGKTPVVAAIARHLTGEGLNVAILSRGYKGRGTGVRVVSVGEGPLLGPQVAGDEPVLLAGDLPGVSVVVGPDRYRAGLHALERLPVKPEIFILEDGFSHVRLFRDLDLLTFPDIDPFGGGKLLPTGKLREPLMSSQYADAVLLTGSHAEDGGDLARCLKPFGFRGPGFAARTIVGQARVERGEALEPGARVLLVAGIARPDRVLASAEALTCEVSGFLSFPDHHDYPPTSLERIVQEFSASGAEWILTTGKDHVKLLGRLDLPLAMLPLRAEPEAGFWDWLRRRLEYFT